MRYDEFLQKWMNKAIDWDGVYGAQCVDLVAQYCTENAMPVAYANAKDWADHPALRGSFNWIVNDPKNLGQLPSRGDIIVWNGGVPGSGGYGHIAIWDMRVKPGYFNSLDQNWGGKYVHFVTHTWDYVIGWWSPKPTPPPVPAPIPAPDPAQPPPPVPAPVVTPDITPAPITIPDPPIEPVIDPPVEPTPPAIPTPDTIPGTTDPQPQVPETTKKQPRLIDRLFTGLLNLLLRLMIFRKKD